MFIGERIADMRGKAIFTSQHYQTWRNKQSLHKDNTSGKGTTQNDPYPMSLQESRDDRST